MNRTIKSLAFVAIGLLAGWAIQRFVLAPHPTSTLNCCQNEASCDLPAPDSISAIFSQTNLSLSWTPVPNVEKYLVNVYDLNNEAQPLGASRVVVGQTLSIDDEGFVPNHDYEVRVASICDNCVPSSLTARATSCFIVIDDICKFGINCEGGDKAHCNCSIPVSPITTGSTTYNFAGTGTEMYNVVIKKSATEYSSFVFITQKPSRYRFVCMKDESEVDADCSSDLIVENQPRQMSSGCGLYSHSSIGYDFIVDLLQFEIKNLPSGYTVGVTRCDCSGGN
ncbi:MAG: fibronectin type III domain-containing protein [Flavobacterium sp.]|jgi:hypothetical protein|nr:fibronectin type III domain-containing protein [Flavobacterium sp.]